MNSSAINTHGSTVVTRGDSGRSMRKVVPDDSEAPFAVDSEVMDHDVERAVTGRTEAQVTASAPKAVAVDHQKGSETACIPAFYFSTQLLEQNLSSAEN